MRDHILSEIRRLANENGGQPPGFGRFEKETGIRRSAWIGVYWARWGDAVTEAGFQPNARPEKLDGDILIRKIANLAKALGRIPSAMEFKMYRRSNPEHPSHDAIYRTFGSTDQMLRRLAEWCRGEKGFDDVAAMLNGRATSDEPTSKPADDGFVYLIQWGANYKIGRGDQLERRVKQVRTGLPDSGKLIHAIKTDDPPGIEAYWHRRFADKRAENGEWFKLSKSDIAAFKRRKFQ
jgi:hypothetical protein